ncbi:MAG TPA: hypothetical protein VMN36_06405 [Verrucomicrobiales bacterium]|nr:hypothetical protein [Verrucomicrobiales bacterium]
MGEPHRGTAILVLGILSIAFTFTFYCSPLGLGFGIAAWLMSRKDLRKMDQGIMDPAGRQITMGGKVCAIVGTILSCCMFLLAVLYAVIAGIFIAISASR